MLWDVGDPRHPFLLKRLPTWRGFASLAFFHDGRTLIIGSKDGTLSLWDLDSIVDVTAHPVALACALLNGVDPTLWASDAPELSYEDPCAPSR